MVLVKFTLIGVSLIFGISQLFNGKTIPDTPKLNDTWWVPENSNKVDKSIKPFKITFPTEDVDYLKARLSSARSLKPSPEGVAWSYGLNHAFVPVFVDFWLNKYNFTQREEYLNQYPQFTTNIQGLDMHFLHVKPANNTRKRVLPLLIQHGWPGSVVEFYKIIPLLTTPRDGYDFVFEIIAPSLPGFGYSSGATIPGMGSAQVAVVLKNLMLRLGFNKFYTQGGDWGAVTTAHLASLFPKHVLGMHSNMCTVKEPTQFTASIYQFWPASYLPNDPKQMTQPVSRDWSVEVEEMGYLHIQATKPETLGIALSDSPVGMASWILEKFSSGTNLSSKWEEDGGLLDKYPFEEVLDNIMLYWMPNAMSTSIRLYAEHFTAEQLALGLDYVPITVPSACAKFPYDVMTYQTAAVLSEIRYKNLVHYEVMERGGHFAAFEEPQLLADDIWTSIGIMESNRAKNKTKAQ